MMMMMIDVALPVDAKPMGRDVARKEAEKKLKHKSLCIEL
jgi:hypothetical protein